MFIAIIFSSFIAFLTASFIDLYKIENTLLYSVFGFFFAFSALSMNVKSSSTDESSFGWQTEQESAAEKGAILGHFYGLVAFPIFYNYPHLLEMIPGVKPFVGLTMRFSMWLYDFFILKIIIWIMAGSFLLRAGFFGLMTAFMLIAGITALFERVFAGKQGNG